MIFRCDLHLLVNALPNMLHIMPVSHDSVLHGIVEGEKASELLGAVSNDGLFFFDASCHYARVLGDSDKGWKDGLGNVLSGKSRFDDA